MTLSKSGFIHNDVLHNILSAIGAICILLLGMSLIHFFVDGLLCSVFSVIPMAFAILFLLKATRIDKIIGKNIVLKIVILSCVLTLLNFMFSAEFEFHNFMAGNIINVSSHPEHTLTYNQISGIAQGLLDGKNLENATKGLALQQYFWLYTYSSLIFVFGGFSVFHICIWNMIHVVIAAVFVVLISYNLSNQKGRELKAAFYFTMLMPFFLATFAYHRDMVGCAVAMIGLYIFVSVRKSLLWSLLLMPVYGFMFWCARYQYLLIAVALFAVSSFENLRAEARDGKAIHKIIEKLIFICTIVLILGILISRMNIFDYISSDLHIDNYIGGSYGLFSLFQRLVRCLAGHFPWTNILHDKYWTYHIFLLVQGWLNDACLVLLFFEFIHKKKKLRDLIFNPALLSFTLFYLSGFLGALHVTYLSFGFPLLVGQLERSSTKHLVHVFILVSAFFLFTGALYELLGLTGLGLFNVQT